MHIKQKKKYVFLIGLAVVGILFGIVFSFILSNSDKLLVESSINNFFNAIEHNEIHYMDGLFSSLFAGLLYIVIVWFLGISIIGIPIILFLLFIKGFIMGFSIGSIISIYKVKGIIGAFLYIFPHHILSIISYILLCYFAIVFSKRLFDYLFLKKEVGLKKLMRKYIKIFLICFVVSILCSLSETFLAPALLKLFTNYLI